MDKFKALLIGVGSIITFLCILFGGMTPAGPQIADGYVVSAMPGTTALIITDALNGVTGTFIMESKAGDFIMYVKNFGGWYGFVPVERATMTIPQEVAKTISANVANAKTFNDLKTFLLNDGWRVIPQSHLGLYWLWSTAQLASTSFTSFIVIPANLTNFGPQFPGLYVGSTPTPVWR